jgi:hypothetical protein
MTPTKFNGPKLDAIIMASHITMMNWEAIEKMRKKHPVLDNIGVILAVGSLFYLAIR